MKFAVVAVDAGSYPRTLSSSAVITVVVDDRNDNAPKFAQPVYEATVSDLAKRGQFVAVVRAYDRDASDIDSLRYVGL